MKKENKFFSYLILFFGLIIFPIAPIPSILKAKSFYEFLIPFLVLLIGIFANVLFYFFIKKTIKETFNRLKEANLYGKLRKDAFWLIFAVSGIILLPNYIYNQNLLLLHLIVILFLSSVIILIEKFRKIIKIIILFNQESNILDWYKNETSSSTAPIIMFVLFYLGFGQLFMFRINDGLTAPEILAKRYYKESMNEYRIGAICFDGWKSSSTGRGTCSHHGGVRTWIMKEEPRRAYDDCFHQALKVSWIEN